MTFFLIHLLSLFVCLYGSFNTTDFNEICDITLACDINSGCTSLWDINYYDKSWFAMSKDNNDESLIITMKPLIEKNCYGNINNEFESTLPWRRRRLKSVCTNECKGIYNFTNGFLDYNDEYYLTPSKSNFCGKSITYYQTICIDKCKPNITTPFSATLFTGIDDNDDTDAPFATTFFTDVVDDNDETDANITEPIIDVTEPEFTTTANLSSTVNDTNDYYYYTFFGSTTEPPRRLDEASNSEEEDEDHSEDVNPKKYGKQQKVKSASLDDGKHSNSEEVYRKPEKKDPEIIHTKKPVKEILCDDVQYNFTLIDFKDYPNVMTIKMDIKEWPYIDITNRLEICMNIKTLSNIESNFDYDSYSLWGTCEDCDPESSSFVKLLRFGHWRIDLPYVYRCDNDPNYDIDIYFNTQNKRLFDVCISYSYCNGTINYEALLVNINELESSPDRTDVSFVLDQLTGAMKIKKKVTKGELNSNSNPLQSMIIIISAVSALLMIMTVVIIFYKKRQNKYRAAPRQDNDNDNDDVNDDVNDDEP